MKTYLTAVFEEKWEQAELPYPSYIHFPTQASPKRIHASVERARKIAETHEVKESDGKPFTRTLKRIELCNFMEKRIMWEKEA